jgi:hypothetical protein
MTISSSLEEALLMGNKFVKPIKGSQFPIQPNNVQEECICVPKVYDWVVFPDQDTNKVPVPEPCRTEIEALIASGVGLRIETIVPTVPPIFPISCGGVIPQPGFSCAILPPIRRTTIPGPSGTTVEVGIVRFLFSVTVTVVIIREDTGAEVCRFDASIQLSEQVVLCLPEPLDENNVRCRITQLDVTPTGIIFDGLVELDVSICSEVQVEAEVKLEVLGKFCQPRGPIPVPPPGNACLPFVEFPPQCPSFFPPSDCTCRGSANGANPSNLVDLGVLGIAIGTTTIMASICPECETSGSTLTFTFTNTDPDYVAGDQSFRLNSSEVDPPLCVATLADVTTAITGLLLPPTFVLPPLGPTPTALSVSGNAILQQTNGTPPLPPQGVRFNLLLVNPTPGSSFPDVSFYILTLFTLGTLTPIFTTVGILPAGSIIIQACRNFPPLV